MKLLMAVAIACMIMILSVGAESRVRSSRGKGRDADDRLTDLRSALRDLDAREERERKRSAFDGGNSDNENENGGELDERVVQKSAGVGRNLALSNRNQKAGRGEEEFGATVLVTGGGGFVGRRLARRLLSEGNRVVSVDNFISSIRGDSEPLLRDFPRTFSLIDHDISLPNEALERQLHAVGVAHVDQIYNLACPASPPIYQAYPLLTLKTNYLGVWNMLELARKYDATLLQASTSEVYGEPQVHPQSEDYYGNVNVIGKRSCYDEGKRVAETIIVEHARAHNTDVRIVRIFNTFGPGMHPYDGRVVSNFIRQALANQDITIYGDGTQTRSFQFVDDLVEGMHSFMNAPRSVGMGPINFGNPDERTIAELADVILELVANSQSKLVFKPKVSDDPSRRQPDISRAKRLLNWEPRISMIEGLRATIDYFAQLNLANYKRFPGSPSFVSNEVE